MGFPRHASIVFKIVLFLFPVYFSVKTSLESQGHRCQSESQPKSVSLRRRFIIPTGTKSCVRDTQHHHFSSGRGFFVRLLLLSLRLRQNLVNHRLNYNCQVHFHSGTSSILLPYPDNKKMGCCNSVDDSRGNTPSSAASSSRRTRGARRSSILTTPKRRGEVTVPCQDDQMLGVAPGASMTQSQTAPTA